MVELIYIGMLRLNCYCVFIGF